VNAQEAANLAYYVKRAAPHQAFDQQTPMVWADALADLRYEDGQEAVRALVKEQQYVLPADVRRKVKQIRGKRIAEHPPVNPPPDLTPRQTMQWRREIDQRIGDGEQIDPDYAYGELRPRDMRALMAPTKEGK